jgi:hypothetical protein
MAMGFTKYKVAYFHAYFAEHQSSATPFAVALDSAV